MQENTNQTDPAYQSKVYKALKENLQGFDRTEEGFKLSLKDRKYQSKVYKALKDNLEGFDKSEDEFYSLVSDAPQKKNPNPSGVSNSGTGSSAYQGNAKGFPKVDANGILPNFDEMKSVSKPVVPKPTLKNKNTIVDYKKPKEDTPFFDYLKENLDTGLATVSKSIYDAPGLVYDAAASITNPIFKAMGVDEDKLASSDKLANDLGFKNIPSEILKEKIKVSNEKISEYSKKNGGDALAALENGNYSGAAKLIAGTTVQSLPIMVAAMVSGGSAPALTTIGLSTASTKNAELKEEHPEMKLGTRVSNAATSGIIEAVTGHLFTGASGAVMKKILAEKGAEVGSRIISKSFKRTIENAIEKNPLVSALGEVVEETAVEFGNQASDIASGIRKEFDVHAIKNAGLSATGMGGLQTIGVYGAKGYIRAKDYNQIKSVNKEIFKLRTEIENGNLSDDNKQIIGTRIDRLLLDNKKLLGGELEKINALPIETKKELNALNSEFDDISQKYDNIIDDADLSMDVKDAMLNELKTRTEIIGKRKNEILSLTNDVIVDKDFSNFNGVEPDFNIENQPSTDFTTLSTPEQTKLKDQASRELLQEKNPDGKEGKFTVTEEEITKRAIENYNKAEVPQQPESEKIDDIQNNKEIDVSKAVVFESSNGGFFIADTKANHLETDSKGERVLYNTKEEAEAKLAEIQNQKEASTEQELTDEEALDAIDNTEEDNTETPTETVETPTETKPALPELNEEEFLDFVENDFLSDERLTDIATKVRENKDLMPFEKRIAKKKESEIAKINKKVQAEVEETNRKAEVDALSKIPAMDRSEFVEYTNSEKASQERLNSIAYKKANNIELNNFEAEVYQENKKAVDKINKSKNLKENLLDKVPTEQKYTTKEGKYTVAKNGNELELYDNNGQPVTLSPKTKQKYFLEALENGFMKRTEELKIPEGITAAEIEAFEIENETDPGVILEKLLTTDPKIDGENVADVKDYAIAIYINKVTESSFIRFGDRNKKSKPIAINYFSKDGRAIDDLALEISSEMVHVEPQDIVDFIIANPSGPKSVLSPKNPAYQNLIDKFVELTGFRPTQSQIMDFKSKEVTPTQIDFEIANEVEVNDEIADDIIDLVQAQEEFDKWFSTLTIEEQANFYFDLEQDYPNKYYQQRYNEQQEYEKSEKTTGTATPNTQGESKPNGSMGQNPQQAGSGKGNNNVPERSSGETQTTSGEQGVKTASSLKSEIKDEFDVLFGEETILVGSVKRGEAKETSDIDIVLQGMPHQGSEKISQSQAKENSNYALEKLQSLADNGTISDLQLKAGGNMGVTFKFKGQEFQIAPNPKSTGSTNTESGEQGVKPISQLGTGSNVYFEENGIRVNDSGNGVIMNVQSKEDFGGMANWNIPFENSKQAVQIAKQLSEIYPQGVPRALLLQKVVEDMVNPKAGERKEEKPKLTESEQVARQHKGIIYKNPKDGYYYEVTGYNSGYYTLKDLETGKVIKEKEEIFEKDFIDVTYEIGQQNKGIQSESSGVQNSTNYDVTQYQDNVFEVKEYGRNDAPTYKVVVGKAFDLDNSEVTKNGKPLAKNEKVPQDVLLAIQSHVDKFNPESKQREIKKFLNEKPKAKVKPEQTDNKLKVNVIPNGNTAFDKQAQKFINAYLELKSKYKLKQKAFVNFAVKNFGVNSKNKNFDVFTLVDLNNNELYHFKSIKDLYQGALDLDLEEFHIVRENRKNNVINYDYTVGTLFGDTDFELYDENGNLKEQVKNDAISIIENYFNPTEEVKETPTPEPKQSKRKIRDEKIDAELDNAFKDLRDELGKLMSGINPELAIKAAKIIAIYTKAGVYKLADIIEDAYEKFGGISKEMFDAIKSGYASFRENTDDQTYSKLDENTRNYTYEYFKNRLANEEVRTNPKQEFVDDIQNRLINKEKLNIVSIRKIADSFGLTNIKDTTLQEYVEMAIINEAKNIANRNDLSTKEKYDLVVELYETQPTISMRSSERIEKQQYSTPIPMSFLAGQFVRDIAPSTILEPSAGNGMMIFNVDAKNVIANEIDKVRLENLKEQGFRQVTNQDGTLPFNLMVDGIVTNPPFGPAPKKDYLGYGISGLDEQMVVNALESMNDNGRASIVIGGHTNYNDNGTLKSQRAFLNYLYNYYNVTDIINVGGNLFQKQGTTFPTRMILIDGRKKPLVHQSENKIEFAPLKTDENSKIVTNFNELYDRIEASKQKQNENILSPSAPIVDNNGEKGNAPETNSGVRNPTNSDQLNLPGDRAKQKPDASGKRPNGRKNGSSNQPGGLDLFSDEYSGGTDTNLELEGEQSQSTGVTIDTENGRTDDSTGGIPNEFTIELSNKPNELDGNNVEVDINSEKTPYPKQSKSTEIGSVVPTNMAQALSNILSQFGDIDAFVQAKLGYKTKEELFNALSAEQVDSVALAIYQMEKGKGLIIGDMTGVGKGRQAAAIIRYARLSGKKPVFFTEKPHLFSDLYRDLRDIGSSQLKPLIINQKSSDSDPSIIDENGNKIYSPLSAQQIKGVLSSGKVPSGYDYVLITYSQLNGNLTKGLSSKQQFFADIAQDNIVVFDESHNAGGSSSNTGLMIREILPLTSGVTYLSGTFAKKPENMPLYALKTSMSDANMSQEELISAIQQGGVPLQEIMSRNLVEMGEMIRRERDFTGVTIDWENLEQNKQELETIFDENIEIFNELIQFQREHINPIIEGLDDDLADIQGGAESKKGTADFGISNTPFASKTFNLVRQLLFSLKAEDVANETIKELKAGRKPVIAVGNTMETFIKDIGEGNTISNYNYSLTLRKGLDGLFRYTEKDFNGNAEQKALSVNDLSEEGIQKYNELVERINKVSANITISPIDIIKTRIKQAGFSVGELTGRSSELQINDDGTATVIKRQDKDKKKLARDFNNGEIDVLILNQSASTGISLHASKTFKDQRQRVMLSAQTQLDVNTEVQMRGRIDRTGQVLRGAYRYLISPIPAEQRLIMMFKAKLKSLDANTTSSQKSKTNDIEIVDFLNKYGDEIVVEYLKENREINDKLLDPLKFEGLSDEKIDEIKATDGDASKVSGRVALLSVKEQSDFYNEVAERYTSFINYLNSNNSNDLEITTLPLNAETKSSVVVVQGNNNGSPFSEDSIRETVEVDVLKKPLKAQEIDAEMEKFLDGKTNLEYKNSNKEKLNNFIEALNIKEEKTIRANAEKKYQAFKTKIEKEANKQGLVLAEKLLFVAKKLKEYSDITNFKVSEAKRRNENKKQVISSMFSSFNVGRTYLVPITTDVSINTIYSQGIFLGYKMKERLNPSNITAVFATLDSRRKVEIPFSKIQYLNTIVAETSRSDSRTLDADLDNWDSKIPTGTKRTAYIVTGNILQAYSVNKQGQLVSYTTDNGQIKQGILLPENYKPEDQKMRVQIIKVIDKIKAGVPMVDASGDISISKQNGTYQLNVPLSKTRGGKYFLDDKLRDMIVGRDFRQLGQGMVGVVTENRLEDILGYLSSVHNTSVEIDTKPAQQKNNEPNEPKDNIRFQLGEQKAFETNDNTKATKENLQAEFPDAIVVQSESELPTSIQNEIREQRAEGDVKGVYHKGEVYLVADNLKTIGEATGTYRHEMLGHKGVTDYLADKLNDYTTRIIDNAKGGQLRKLQELAAKYGLPTDLNNLTDSQKQLLGEEYIAMISENKSQYPQAWNDLVSFIREILRKLGINLQVTIAEIQALLGKVEKQQKQNNTKSTDNTGKTRFQIIGENANLKEDYRNNLGIAKELEAKDKTAKEIWVATGWEKGVDGKWRAEIDDSKMTLDPDFMQMRGYTLGEAIKYDELFELYPDIKNVRVSVIPNLGNMLGAYLPTKNLIMLNGARTEEEVRSTLLHEIQHIVQSKEGFATGGTSKMAETYLRKKISDITIAKHIPSFLAKAASKLLQGVNLNSSITQFNSELEKAKHLLSKETFDLYQSIAGEVESRNVQERMNMTSDERKNTPLSQTEDVEREEQVVLLQGKKGAFFAEMSSSPKKDLRLPQTIARQALDQIKEDIRNKVAKKDILNNAVALIQESDWYYDLDDTRKARVNNTTVKSLLENTIKEINYLEDKVEEYKQKLIENKLTTREVFNDIVAFLQTNKIKGKITPTEVNRLIKAAVQITVKRDTSKALDDFMNLYEVIKEKALFRVDKNAREQAEVEFVTPIVESLVQRGYDLDTVLDYFETISQKRMAEILYHKEKSKLATEEERVNKAKETLDKQREDLRNATYISFRDWLKRNRLYWINLMSDRSFVPATLMKKTGMEQSYYQFKNTNGYGHNAKEMYDKAFDKIWKTLTVKKVELLNDFIQMMRIIEIENNTSKVIQHPNNLSSLDAKSFLNDQKRKLGEKEFNDMQKRAREYFNVYQEILDLQLENGFISQETYDALNGKDYQPRLFIQHALNFDGELTLDQKSHLNGVKKGLGDNPVKNLDSGSANSLIYNAQWLLSNSISTLYQNIADNTLNKLLIEKELPKAQETFDELLTKPENELTIEEKTFIEYFTEFSEKVKTNEIIGFNSENNTPSYKYEVPDKSVAKYYWSDGVKHQFFIESELADQFDGKKGAFLNQKNQTAIQLLSLFTGVGILKYMATGNNPLFILTNTPRDFAWTILVSEHYGSIDLFGKKIYGIPLIGTAQMTYQLFPSTYDFIKTKLGYENTDMSLFFQHGGSFEFLHKQGTIAKKSGTYRFIKKPLTSVLGANMQPRVERYVDNNWMSKGITLANEWSEIAFRIATFRRSVNAQLKEWKVENESQIGDLIDENGIMLQTKKEILDEIYRKAANDAKSVLDYSQGGRLVKDLDLFLPYANVAAQSTRVYFDTMKKKPLVTTLKTFYNVAIPLATTLTLAMLFIAGDDDEPEEDKGKTAEIKYLEFIDGIPKETRNKYHLFPTKKRDEKGNRIAYKIAKDQFLIPYSSFAESIMLNVLRKRNSEHYKQIEAKTISKELATNIALHNLQFKTITDVPLVKASFAWIAGYDTYNNKQLDQYEKIEQLEGIGNPNVEDFYKHFGRELGISPIRAKTAIEAIITSPQSNPFLATGYEVMDYAFTDKSMSHLGKGIRDMLLKGLKNRTTTKSTEWTKAENILNENKKEQIHIMLKEEAIRQLFKDKAQEVIDGKTTAEEALGELRKQYESDPNYPSYMKSFRNKVRSSRTDVSDDGIMSKIKREKSPGAKAVMIRDFYGDINSPENAEIKKELLEKRVINGATMRYLERKTAN